MSIKPPATGSEETGPEGGSAAHWPQSGAVVFDQYQARYRKELDLTLKGVTCAIQCGEKASLPVSPTLLSFEICR